MTNQTTGTLIATLRKGKGLTQAQLAAQMNVTDKAVSKWERDLSFPDIASIPKLAQVLGVSTEELIEAKEKRPKPNEVREIISLILRVVPLAMGVAVVVLSVLGEVDVKSTAILLGSGLFCVSLYLLENGGKKEEE